MKHSTFLVVITPLLFTSLSLFAQTNTRSNGEYMKNLLDDSVLFDTTAIEVQDSPLVTADSVIEWKQWRTIENFYFGKNRGALPMIADLGALHPYFRDRVIELIRVCQQQGIALAIVESYRTPAKQAEYFAMGKKYTSTPGGKSRHQYGLAIDVVPVVDSVAVWNNHKLWKKIGIAGERLGLLWGGRWKVLYDPGHFEWSGGLTRHELEKGLLPEIPAAIAHQYPLLQDELKQLQVYWDAWEVEQSMTANNQQVKADNAEDVVGAGN
jgi:hypothetical protein